MRILISNDDGIFAEGILRLVSSLITLGEITVVAPDMERSATGHAITMHHPLRVKEVKLPGLDVKAWSVDGTPADCVKMGVDVLMDKPPDFIFTGINRGSNLGTDVLYSGTVSAALEGCILGFPSAAFSLTAYQDADFTYAGKAARMVAERIMANPLPKGTLLNVNIPHIPESEIRGFAVTRLGFRKYSKNYVERKDPRGRTYYWLAGEAINDDSLENTDIDAVKSKYVSITPLHYDLTNYDTINLLGRAFAMVPEGSRGQNGNQGI